MGNWIFTNLDGLNPSAYLRNIQLLILLPVVIYGALLYKNTAKVSRIHVLALLVFHLILSALSIYYLVILPSEAIHFLQYAFLAFFLLAFSRMPYMTIFLIVIAAIVDEAVQYVYIRPDATTYFDFNDLVLDLIGAGFGLLLGIVTLTKQGMHRLHIRWAVGLPIGAAIILGVLHLLGYWSIGPSDDPSVFQLNKEILKDQFWTFKRNGAIYHILSVSEGLVLIILLCTFHLGWTWWIYKKITNVQQKPTNLEA